MKKQPKGNQKNARLIDAFTGKHSHVKVKMDAGDGRTVLAEVDPSSVNESLAHGVIEVKDAEGYTVKTADGKYQLKAGDIEAACLAPAEAEDAEPVR